MTYCSLMNLNPLPDQILSATEHIFLSDLLKSPSFRHFVLSALGNGVSIAHEGTDLKNEEEMYLRFKIDQVIKNIPEDDRRDYFHESGRLIREYRERRDERRNLQSSPLRHLPVKYQ